MELLNDFGREDPVSELLRVVRTRSTVYCHSRMGAPWGFGVEAHGHPTFHVVTSGDCLLEVDGEPNQLRLSGGDLVLLPTGPRHWMRDSPGSPAPELERILDATSLDVGRRLRYGGDGPVTELLCGGFELEGADPHPLLRSLPAALHVRGVAGRPVPWLAATLALLDAETTARAPGAAQVAGRLADVLLAQALGVALTELQAADRADLRALRDPQVAAAIELIHRRPERAWTVGELAANVALSRSTFAARFRKLVGESPKRYVTRMRLACAAVLLHRTDAPLAEIASRAGYASPFSFNKAFKRSFGIAPGAYRGRPGRPPDLSLSPETVTVGAGPARPAGLRGG